MDMHGLGYVILPRLPFKDSRDETIYDYLFKRAEYRSDQQLEPGQTIIKLVDLAKRFNWSADQIKYSMDRMVKQEYLKLDRLPQKRGFIVTVLHYAEYIQLGNYNKKKDLAPAQEKQQEDEKKMKSNAFAFFEDEGFGLLSSFMAEKLNSLIDDYGEDKVLEAMKEAVTRNARNLAYVQRILQSNKNKSKEWQHGNTQNAKYRRGNGSNTEEASAKVSPIFGGVGRVRRKG
ncbi:DnaD domain-containing protein [Bacillus subtilis]|uniref:DnaD domain-containing protein n=1 Tax=Bacillus subtilis TaxID=1423 RepID=A0AAX3RPD7_BACIU|nr:DnaD domain protein [Bacillus subtilis]WEZ04514.1 DnaD domain protein [Bacillus subtilis]